MTSHEEAIYKILVEELWPGGITDGHDAESCELDCAA